jgi:hypothetical protein
VHAGKQRQAVPLRPSILRDVLSTLGDTDIDRRDAALLSTLYMLALRRSEVIEIDFERRGDGLAVLRMTDHGLELELLRSKASQEAPVRITVDRHHNPRRSQPRALDRSCQSRTAHAAVPPDQSAGWRWRANVIPIA